jgi:pimeloyl-ACP methyl ester carboxylesterase
VIDPELDAYVPSAQTKEVAARLGVEVVTIPDRGHWWMVADAGPVADALVEFWDAN